jgi:hypothetical protein
VVATRTNAHTEKGETASNTMMLNGRLRHLFAVRWLYNFPSTASLRISVLRRSSAYNFFSAAILILKLFKTLHQQSIHAKQIWHATYKIERCSCRALGKHWNSYTVLVLLQNHAHLTVYKS